jgi:hypothetical protein
MPATALTAIASLAMIGLCKDDIALFSGIIILVQRGSVIFIFGHGMLAKLQINTPSIIIWR